jgi:hypothetical protein
VPMHRVPRVGPEWRFRWSSNATTRRQRRPRSQAHEWSRVVPRGSFSIAPGNASREFVAASARSRARALDVGGECPGKGHSRASFRARACDNRSLSLEAGHGRLTRTSRRSSDRSRGREIVGALGHCLCVAEQVARLRGVGRDRNVLYRVALATAACSMIRSTPTVCTPSRERRRLRRPATVRARRQTPVMRSRARCWRASRRTGRVRSAQPVPRRARSRRS